MLPPEVLRQIRRLQITSRRSVRTLFGGEYRSAFKGAGLSFEEVREYVPGDDVRAIDWNVTARTGQPYLKRYAEERELTVLLMLDLSASQRYGSGTLTKRMVAAELAAVLALAAVAHQDRVGLIGFTTTVERAVRPAKGTRHAFRLLRDVLAFEPRSPGTDLAEALGYLNRVHRRRAIVFLFSDFLIDLPAAADTLRRTARQHDLVAVRLSDERELAWPDAGLVRLEDAETGRQRVIDAGSPAFRAAFAAHAEATRAAFAALARRSKFDLLDVKTDGRHFDALARFFARRDRQRPTA